MAEETPSPVPSTKRVISSDDDEAPTKSKESNVTKRKFTRIKVKGVSEETPSNSEDEQLNISSKSRAMKSSVSKANLSDSNDDIVNISTKTRVIVSSSDTDSSGSDIVLPGKHRNLKRREGSAEKASPQSSSNDNSTMAPRHGMKRKIRMPSASSEASDVNDNNQVEISCDSTNGETAEHDDDDDDDEEDDSGSEVDECSSSGYGHFRSPRAKLMQRKRDKKRRLLSKLIETRKRRDSNGILSAV